MASPAASTPAHLDKSLIHPAYTGHFGIRTSPENFDAMVNWHLSFFNGTCILRNDIAAFITYDHEHHRLVILNDASFKSVPKSEKGSMCGIYHIAFTLNSLADLATSYEQKKAKGIEPHWPVNHGISTSMYYYDPDGNEFEMQVDNYDTAEEVFEFMKTEEFKLNPIGVDFRPEEFVKRVKSGEDESSIKKRPLIGKRPNRWVNSIYFKEEDAWKSSSMQSQEVQA
jgi:catechol 2,3-dioxygenase-like lactoylglutathione lyase family enzyme